MDLLSQKINKTELKEGDHVYTWRKQLYNHHGIFIGEGKIIHFVNGEKRNGGHGVLRFSAASGGSSDKKKKKTCTVSCCGSEKVNGSGVRLSCIDCFIKTGSLYRFKYQVSSSFLYAKLRGGTCTMEKSDPPQEVIHRAAYLHENGYAQYNLMNNNCEDFALYCKTGLWSTDRSYQGRSSQANAVHPTSRSGEDNGAVEFLLRVATSGVRSVAKRETKDLGVRQDVEKVPVEALSSFILNLSLK